MVRVLVVDDSVTARSLITAVLRADPAIEVVGHAKDGAEALRAAKELRPDVITMDFQMPVLDGFEAAFQIMMEAPTPIVIVSGSLDVRDVVVSMEAMRAGALAIVAKPPGPGSPAFARESRSFANTVKAMSQVKIVRRFGNRPAAAAPTRTPAADAGPGLSVGAAERSLLALAASTGGPAALHKILTELPADFPAPILVVQHIAIGFAEGLAAWLDRACRLKVKLAQPDEPLLGGVVYLAPDDRHLGITPAHRAQVVDAPPINGFRPSATHLFESAAATYGSRAVGVILTGMGEDGAVGLQRLHAAGGFVMAQDEASSAVFGMPKAAIQTGMVDQILPIETMATQIEKMMAQKKS
jgi:two-component system chemotaxis response regulator CheB